MGKGLFGFKRDVYNFFVGCNGGDLARGVYVFSIDKENGEIFKKKYYKGGANPVYMTRVERFVYVCYKNGYGAEADGGIWQYAAMDVQFGLTARTSDKGNVFEHCYLNKAEDKLYAVNYYEGQVVMIPIVKKKVSVIHDRVQLEGHSLDPKKQDRTHPVFVTESPDQKYIIVLDLGTDEIIYFETNEDNKLVKDEELSVNVKPGNGPRKMIFNESGTIAYVMNEISSTVDVYANNDNHLELLQTVDTFPKDEFQGVSSCGDVILSEAQDYLFVSNKGHDSVGVFRILKDGTLKYVEFIDTDENPKVLMIYDDKWFVVGAQKGGSIESWEIKKNDRHGVLFETGYAHTVPEPVTFVKARVNM